MRSFPARSITFRILATTRCFWSASRPRPAAQSAGGSPPEPSERLATDGAQNSDRYAFRDQAGPASSLYGSGWPKPVSGAERAGSSDRPDRLSANIEVEL